jgi:hypothetical protein
MDQYNVNGRLTSISEQELEAQTKEVLPALYAKYKGKK